MIDNFEFAVKSSGDYYCVNQIEKSRTGRLSAQIGHFKSAFTMDGIFVPKTEKTEIGSDQIKGIIAHNEDMAMDEPTNQLLQHKLSMLYQVEHIFDLIKDGDITVDQANDELRGQSILFRANCILDNVAPGMPENYKNQLMDIASPEGI